MKNLHATIMVTESEEFRKGIEQLAMGMIQQYLKNETISLSASIELQKFMMSPENKKKIMEMIETAIKSQVFHFIYEDPEFTGFMNLMKDQVRAKVAESLNDANIQEVIASQVSNIIRSKLKG